MEGGGEESMEGGGESMMMGGLLNCPEGSEELSATRFEYAANGRTVTFAISESWCWDGDEENCPTDYDVNKVEHYRYDGARQRYLVQNLDPDDLDVVVENGEYWSDYDGDDVYGDFEIDEGNGVTTRSFEPGLARVVGAMSEGDGNTDYYHTDHLGTSRRMTAANASVIDSPVFTAFGERRTSGISDPFDRYGYVGAHGYQEQTGFFHEFSHVGHRLYQPRIGRFLQRDPIGIRGGRNVYLLADRDPLSTIDPNGLNPAAAAIPAAAAGAVADGPLPVGDAVLVVTCAVAGVWAIYDLFFSKDSKEDEKEHRKKHDREKHEKGKSRKQKDKGGEKGDKRRPRWK